MAQILLNEEEFSLTLTGTTIVLLPKEFALFRFLYQNPNQAFSREVLLDRVWPLEEPVDRTVDDHIYRLRKKLKEWESHLLIETVRGIGYRLKFVDLSIKYSPSLQDQKFNQQFNALLIQYHLFGQGGAMQTLTGQQEILGVHLDPFYRMYTELLKGNWAVLLEETLSLEERIYFMVVLYGLIMDDPFIGKDVINRVLSSNRLPVARHWELQGMDLVFFLLWCGEYTKASEQAKWALDMVKEKQTDGFQLAVLIQQILPLWFTNHITEADQMMNEAENLLKEKPYLRELSYFNLTKGICLISNGEMQAGKGFIEEGLNIMKQAKFGLQYLHALTHIVHTLKPLLKTHDPFILSYQTQRNNTIKKNNGTKLAKDLLKQINSFL